ncbi:MAG: hypothetical protein A3F13_07780 [Gammaproteobacteria bacterium RIFCSPHIGHO2_12_FULL_40_19]|nr:MAG: hypothetical protein A3F13_07780 [Gammaproteobacteria bacterium RIFCSPHIGHO2_12_FULL_40_19]
MRRMFFPRVTTTRMAAAMPLIPMLAESTHTHNTTSASSQKTPSHFKYYAMAAGFAGFAGYQMLAKEHDLSHLASHLSNTRVAFRTARDMIQMYLILNQLAVFKDNLNPENEKRHIFFRAETAAEARNTMQNGKSPFVIEEGRLVTPQIVDKTLHPNDPEKPGTCRGLTGVTSDLSSTKNAEAVLLIIPTESKLASTALHATFDEHNPKDHLAVAGLKREEVFATIYRDPETGVFSHIDFNMHFAGNLSRLELDAQMHEVCALLPEGAMKDTLLQSIDPKLRYLDRYEDKLAPNAEAHTAGVEARKIYQQITKGPSDYTVNRLSHVRHLLTSVDEVDTLQKDETEDHVNLIQTSDGRVFVRYTEQGGCNPGGFYMGHDNRAYYIKYGPAGEQVLTDEERDARMLPTATSSRRSNVTRFENEVMIGSIYHGYGLIVPTVSLVRFQKNGKECIGIASKLERHLVDSSTHTQKDGVSHEGWSTDDHFMSELLKGALLDFMLGSYDFPGWYYNNVYGVVDKQTGLLHPIRIDTGCGVGFKARGVPFPFNPNADEFLKENLEPGSWWTEENMAPFSECYKKLITDPGTLYNAIHFLESVSPEKLSNIVRAKAYSDPTLTESVIDTILKRREAILERANALYNKMYYASIMDVVKSNKHKLAVVPNTAINQHANLPLPTPTPTPVPPPSPSKPEVKTETSPKISKSASFALSASFSPRKPSISAAVTAVVAHAEKARNELVRRESMRRMSVVALELQRHASQVALSQNAKTKIEEDPKNPVDEADDGVPPQRETSAFGQLVVSEVFAPCEGDEPSDDEKSPTKPATQAGVELSAALADFHFPTEDNDDTRNTSSSTSTTSDDDADSDSEELTTEKAFRIIRYRDKSRLFGGLTDAKITRVCSACPKPDPVIQEREVFFSLSKR